MSGEGCASSTACNVKAMMDQCPSESASGYGAASRTSQPRNTVLRSPGMIIIINRASKAACPSDRVYPLLMRRPAVKHGCSIFSRNIPPGFRVWLTTLANTRIQYPPHSAATRLEITQIPAVRRIFILPPCRKGDSSTLGIQHCAAVPPSSIRWLRSMPSTPRSALLRSIFTMPAVAAAQVQHAVSPVNRRKQLLKLPPLARDQASPAGCGTSWRILQRNARYRTHYLA